MSVSNVVSNLWDTAARPLRLLPIGAALAFVAVAQSPKPPYALLQYATLTGTGNTVMATQIPVVTASGVTVYVNLGLQFDIDSNGNLTVSPGYPQISPAPTVLASSFKAGRYVGPSTVLGGKAVITVSGPGVADGGATLWSLSGASGADGATYPGSASWYAGPIANNPYTGRLASAHITSSAWSYGIGGSSSSPNNYWRTGTLIGVSQIGNTLTIASFTSNNSGQADQSTPTDQITYTLSPTP